MNDENANPGIPKLEVYDQFYTTADAEHLISLLQSNNILHEVEVPKQIMDTVMGGDGHGPKVFVKLPLADFELVNQLREDSILLNIQEGKVVIKYHYLHDNTNEELLEVLRKPDVWSFGTRVIARHLLGLRGVAVALDPQQIKAFQEERIQEIRKP